MKKPLVHIIAAVGRDNVIGRKNALPWHLSADLRRFKALTLGHAVIMGRRTFESIGNPLPARRNIVISRQQTPPGCEVVRSFNDSLAAVAGQRQGFFIIGGGEIYRQALPVAGVLHLTEVEQTVADGDVFFPDFKTGGEWVETSREMPPENQDDATTLPRYAFVTYHRINNKE